MSTVLTPEAPDLTAPGPIFCGALPQELAAAARGQMRWTKRALSFCWIDRVPGLTAAKQAEDTNWAFNQWAQAARGFFTYTHTTDPRRADILLTTAPMGGPGGVLADMMLPPGDNRQLRGRFDTSERWDVSIIFRLVLLHELGHAKGINHINNPGQRSVLDAIYNPALQKLQPLDVAALERIYPEIASLPPGGAIPTPTPVPTPGPAKPEFPFDDGPDELKQVVISLPFGVYMGDLRRKL
jgi:hypothetical protein